MNGRIPGFRFDSKKGRARFEAIVPGTGNKKRHRKTVEVSSREDALTKWKDFRDEILGSKENLTLTLSAYIERYGKALSERVSPETARNEGYVIEKRLLPVLGGLTLDEITDSTASDF